MELNVKTFFLFLAALALTLGILFSVSEYNSVGPVETLPTDSTEVEVDTLSVDTLEADELSIK
jgi:hypothetical protein